MLYYVKIKINYYTSINQSVSNKFINLSDMRFEISKEQTNFISKINDACKNIRNIETECYLHERFNENIIPEFGKIGMLGCPISKQYGGLGYDFLTYVMALQKIGMEGGSLRTFFSAHISIGQLVLQNWASIEQKKSFLPFTTKGESIMAFALSEPLAGSDPSSLTSTIEKKDDYFLLNGIKHWIGNGTFADVFTIYAKEKGNVDSNLNGKISAFIIDKKNFPDFEIVEIKDKIGLLTVKNAQLNFKNYKIPKKNLIGLRGDGLHIAYTALIDGRLSVAAGSIGVMEDCLTESINHSKERVQHNSLLAKKQLIQQHIVQIKVAIESSKWLVYKTALLRQKLHDFIESLKNEYSDWIYKISKENKEYQKLKNEVDLFASMAKLNATNNAFDVSNRSIQIFGSFGYRKTSRVARHFLDSRATTIYEGANEILELKIASLLLGKEYKAY